MTTVQESLAAQRQNIKFDTKKLSQFLYGKEYYKTLKETLDKNPVLTYDFNYFNGGRVAIIKKSIQDFPIVYNTIKDKGLSDQNFTYLALVCMNQMPGGVHIGMFMKCIEIMGSDEQNEEYMEKCKRFQIFGCYAQTEIAHGSDVSSLMTTATLDMETDQFIIDTPNIKAIKFWPGELGIYSTHALVFAQLIIKGKKYGVQAFVVPIRNPQNLQPLPGVQAGDIGPKIGYHSKDNGYLILHKVRIPRKNILSRFMQITKQGQIELKGDPKVSYATMMEIRRHISCTWTKIYASCITIATRYSFFRKQFKNSVGQEISIMDYQLQQEKILDRVAEYYAISTASNKVSEIAHMNAKLVQEQEDFSLMAETHACLSLSKPYFSELIYDGMEICRRACGGHGFSHYSGFPSLINEYAAHITHQGEDTVLYLQVARYLLKSFKHFKMKKKELGKSVKYIQSFDYLLQKRVSACQPDQWALDDFRTIISQAVCHLLNATTSKLLQKQQGYSDKDAWNYSAGIKLRQIAMIHSSYFTFESFHNSVNQEVDEKIKQLTTSLCLLFGINIITYGPITGAILAGGFVNSEQVDSLHDLKKDLIKKLRPDLIGLVDGFGIPDKYIRSALITGNPYENFLTLARENDLNKQPLESQKIVRTIVNEMRNPNASL